MARRVFTPEYKKRIVLEFFAADPDGRKAIVARENLSASQPYQWRHKLGNPRRGRPKKQPQPQPAQVQADEDLLDQFAEQLADMTIRKMLDKLARR